VVSSRIRHRSPTSLVPPDQCRRVTNPCSWFLCALQPTDMSDRLRMLSARALSATGGSESQLGRVVTQTPRESSYSFYNCAEIPLDNQRGRPGIEGEETGTLNVRRLDYGKNSPPYGKERSSGGSHFLGYVADGGGSCRR
jgi:hypothetical protein